MVIVKQFTTKFHIEFIVKLSNSLHDLGGLQFDIFLGIKRFPFHIIIPHKTYRIYHNRPSLSI